MKNERQSMRYTILILIGLLVASCTTTTKKSQGSTRRTTDSAPYELLLVCDKDWLATSDGTVFKECINPEIIGLPAPETNFKLISINPSAFSKTFQGFANIVVADFGSKYTKPQMHIASDVYARGQHVVYLTAPDSHSLAVLATERAAQATDFFITSELQREREIIMRKNSPQLFNAVKKQFGYTMYAPASIDKVKVGKDFIWASSDAEDNRLNICVYTLPLTADSLPTASRFIELRDSVMKINIEGERDGQYMQTNWKTVFARITEFKGQPMVEARGLWEMHADMMGGPFVSYTRIDTIRHLTVTAEGFVFAPEKKKRPYIRELEAALQTLKIE